MRRRERGGRGSDGGGLVKGRESGWAILFICIAMGGVLDLLTCLDG